MMKILFDLETLQRDLWRGMGGYTLRILQELLKYTDVELTLLYSEKLPRPEPDLDAELRFLSESDFTPNFSERFDFLFISNFFYNPVNYWVRPEILSRCGKVVGILYDLIPFLFAGHYFGTAERSFDYVFELESLKLASHLFAISESTKNDAATLLNIPKKNITVVYGGIARIHAKVSPNAGREKYHIVCIAGNDVRKNYLRSALGFCRAYKTGKIDKRAKLLIVCHMPEEARKVVYDELENKEFAGIGKRVVFTGYLPDKTLKKLLTSARLSMFISLYEGLGLPVLESYMAGCACIGSNGSSLKEITHPECQVNPYNTEEISEKIVQLYNDDELRAESVKFGVSLLKKMDCVSAVKRIHKTLKSLLSQPAAREIAVFATMPPASSGIAVYSAPTFAGGKEKWDIFTEINSLAEYREVHEANSALKSKIYPAFAFPFLKALKNYQTAIFVLGNSSHNLAALDATLSYPAIENRFLYLHEAELGGLWLHYCQRKKIDLHKFYKNFYGENDPKLGVLPVVSLTGIKNIIVNNERAKNLIQAELAGKCDVKIFNVFLPVKRLAVKKTFSMMHPGIYIGSFGVPHNVKNTPLIVEAVRYLNKIFSDMYPGNDGRPFFWLVLAGYGTDGFLDAYNLREEKFILGFDAPDKDLFLQLIDAMDILVQLRKNEHGETSGVISQIIGLGKPAIISDKFSEYKNFPNCFPVDDEIDPAGVAMKILLILAHGGVKVPNETLAPYSFGALSKQLYDICSNPS